MVISRQWSICQKGPIWRKWQIDKNVPGVWRIFKWDGKRGPLESGDFEENIKMVRCMMQMRCWEGPNYVGGIKMAWYWPFFSFFFYGVRLWESPSSGLQFFWPKEHWICSAESENCWRISMIKSLGPFRISKTKTLAPIAPFLKTRLHWPLFSIGMLSWLSTWLASPSRPIFFSFVHLLKVLASFINKHHSPDNLQLHNDTTSCPFRFRYMF